MQGGGNRQHRNQVQPVALAAQQELVEQRRGQQVHYHARLALAGRRVLANPGCLAHKNLLLLHLPLQNPLQRRPLNRRHIHHLLRQARMR